jgi:hypothetical protein
MGALQQLYTKQGYFQQAASFASLHKSPYPIHGAPFPQNDSNLLDRPPRTPIYPRIKLRRTPHLIRLRPHLSRIPPILLQIGPKLDILRRNRILPNMRQEEERQQRAEETQRRAHEERILTAPGAIRSAGRMVLDNWENVGTDESADLAKSGGYGKILASNGSGARLRRNEPDIIART